MRGAERDLLLWYGDRSRLVRLRAGAAIIVGRSPDADIFLNATSISRRHCAIMLVDGQVVVEDLGSRNHIFLNDLKLSRGIVEDGAMLQFGKIPFRVEFLSAAFVSCPSCAAEVAESLRNPEGVLVCPSCWSVVGAGGGIAAELEREGYIVQAQLSRDPAVFKVERAELGRSYRVEALPLHGAATDPAEVERFLEEARLAASLSHRNIVQVLDIRRSPRLVYVLMEYDASHSLHDAVKRDGPMAVPAAIALTEGLVEAVAYASQRGVVHGNINPKVVLITSEGRPKLTDFSLARQIRDAATTFDLDASGVRDMLMAPEVYRSAGGEGLDLRTDIFGLGLVLHYALTGRPAFPGRNGVEVALLHSRGEDVRADLTGLPAPLIPLLERMLASNPNNRPSALGSLREELKMLARGAGSPAVTETATDAAAVFSGAITTNELIEFVQMVELHGKTGVLTVKGKLGEELMRGAVQFRDGRIVDATGHVDRGVAARQLLGIRDGRFTFKPQDPSSVAPGGVSLHVSALLMDLAREQDESGMF